MKLKERDVIRHSSNLAELGDKVFPSKLSFAVSYNYEKMHRETERIEKERKKLCERYAEKDEEGKAVMVHSVVNGVKTQEYKMSEENRKAFTDEYDELLDSEVDIEIRTIKREVIEQFEGKDRYSIPTIRDIVNMSFMLED